MSRRVTAWAAQLSLTLSCAGTPAPASVSIAPVPPSSSSAQPVSSGPREVRPGVMRIDKTITFDDCEWVIVEARDEGPEVKPTSELSHEAKRSVGRFIFVHYKLTNLTKTPVTMLARPKVVDGDTREFGPIDMEASYVPRHTQTSGLDSLQPRVQKEYWTVIEVGPNSHDLSFGVHGFSLDGETRLVGLGL